MAGSTLSEILTVTTKTFDGVVLFDPTDPTATSGTFPYGNIGRSETLGTLSSSQGYATEKYAEYSFAQNETNTLSLDITVPFSETHKAELRSLRSFVTNRQVLVYKDSRGRFLWGVLLSIQIKDTPVGASVTGAFIVSEHA